MVFLFSGLAVQRNQNNIMHDTLMFSTITTPDAKTPLSVTPG